MFSECSERDKLLSVRVNGELLETKYKLFVAAQNNKGYYRYKKCSMGDFFAYLLINSDKLIDSGVENTKV